MIRKMRIRAESMQIPDPSLEKETFLRSEK